MISKLKPVWEIANEAYVRIPTQYVEGFIVKFCRIII